MTMFDLTGKTALVTGASGGIGAEIAKALIAQGARVAIHGTRREVLETLAQELGPNAVVVTGNLGEAGAPEAVIAEAEAALGGIDILVNNAGITRDGLAMRMKDDDWDAVIAVNLTATFKLSKAVMRGMMKKRWGRIINVTSIVGWTGNPGQANYVASKAGITGMTKALAAELASREITVNCVAPGFIDTPMTHVLTEEQKTKMLQAIPAGRLGSPADVAAAVIYLASPAAGYVTGTTVHVNGGMAML
jgi:3-oxoacyl-[acyl-carrier protein] reductase